MGSGKTTKNLAISESCKSPMSFLRTTGTDVDDGGSQLHRVYSALWNRHIGLQIDRCRLLRARLFRAASECQQKRTRKHQCCGLPEPRRSQMHQKLCFRIEIEPESIFPRPALRIAPFLPWKGKAGESSNLAPSFSPAAASSPFQPPHTGRGFPDGSP